MPSLATLDEDVFQDNTLSFKSGYYALTTVNCRDMFSCSSDLPDSDASTGSDSAISSGGTTPNSLDESVMNGSDADLTAYQCGGTPFPFGKANDYQKPPGPSPHGMRRRRVFSFGCVDKY